MKKYLLLFATNFVLLANSLPAMPLIFKAEKEVKSEDFPQIIVLDTAKYNRLRFAVVLDSEPVKNKPYWIFCNVVEGDDTIGILGLTLIEKKSRTEMLEAVPAKIQIKFETVGKYRLFVWGS